MMNILITGGAGYIGSHTVVELLNKNYNVIIVDNLSNSSEKVLGRIKKITGKNFGFYNIDLRDKTKLEKVFIENSIDGVIHFAAYKAVGESVEKPLKYYNNNLNSTIVLYELMKKYCVKKIVFSSSATVYGVKNSSPLLESMPMSSTNPYGRTKVMIEQILKDIYLSDNQWGITILRYFNPIGSHKSGEIGENPYGIPNNIMPYITQVAVGKREKLNIFGSDYKTHDGTGVRDYIHVVDLAIGHIKALEKIKNRTGYKIYNLGTGVGYSVLDLVNAFMKVNNLNIPYDIVERRAGDVDICYADATKAEKELNWKTEKSLEDMCKDSWNWQSNNPEGY